MILDHGKVKGRGLLHLSVMAGQLNIYVVPWNLSGSKYFFLKGILFPDGFDCMVSDYKAMKAQKPSSSEQEISERTEIQRVGTQGPVNISVNGKNITLFGN